MPAPRRAVLAAAAAATVLTVFASPAAAFAPVTADGAVVRYPQATDQLPDGAWARVRAVETGSGKTVLTLLVRGFAADETYGAHAHYKPCGATATSSGAHYQDLADPATVGAAADPETVISTNPAYANSDNEVWLDFTTNSQGIGRAQTVVDWQFRPAAAGRSVVIHESHTGPTGGAGPRLGCLTVPF